MMAAGICGSPVWLAAGFAAAAECLTTGGTLQQHLNHGIHTINCLARHSDSGGVLRKPAREDLEPSNRNEPRKQLTMHHR